MESVIIVIPAEGDSPETEIWYIKALTEHYRRRTKKKPKVLTFAHNNSDEAVKLGVALSTQLRVREFIEKNDFEEAEIHAQGGLGAYVAYEFLRYLEIQDAPDHYGRRINLTGVFLIGGAPCDSMTTVAKIFHRTFVRLWYHVRWLVPFFADDPPNPTCQNEVAKIRASSTRVMQDNPELYRDQLAFIGSWQIPSGWQLLDGCRVWYVPNGETLRSKLWDNTYDDAKACAFWLKCGASVTRQPGGNFSFYSMMPARELFTVMDEVR